MLEGAGRGPRKTRLRPAISDAEAAEFRAENRRWYLRTCWRYGVVPELDHIIIDLTDVLP